jgi:hypothetical protein
MKHIRYGGRRSVAATRAAKTFGQLVDTVRETRAVYVVERGGRAVAQIGPVESAESRRCTVADLVALLTSSGGPEAAFRREVKAGVTAGNKPAVPRDPWAD